MDRRLELHEMFCDLLGSRNVYYQPPESTKMDYPAIRYSLASIEERHANDESYSRQRKYQVTLIDYDPDSPTVEAILAMDAKVRFDRSYSADNLSHFVFEILY